MTITTASPVERIARPSQLDAAVARMTGDEPTLTDISTVLHLVGTDDDIDGVRIQALCLAATRALGKYDAWTRSAPPDALKDLVGEALQVCEGPACDNDVAPWDGESFCGPSCRNDYQRSAGEA